VSDGLTLLLFTAPPTSAKFAATTDVLHMNITAKENKIKKIARSIPYTTKNHKRFAKLQIKARSHIMAYRSKTEKTPTVLHRKLKKLTRKPASM
jgi:hypothetical protein